MILQAASDLGLDLPCSVIVGDEMGDIEAGARAGIGLPILVRSQQIEDTAGPFSYALAADLGEALALLRRHLTGPAPTSAASTPESMAILHLNFASPSANTVPRGHRPVSVGTRGRL
jgi:hypothetical protein